MTVHPIDTEALRRLADAAMVEPPWEDAGEWQTDGYAGYVVVSCEQDSDGEYDHVAEAANERLGAFIAAADPNTVRALLDALAAAEHRATRAEAQNADEIRAVAEMTVYSEQALQEAADLMHSVKLAQAEARIKAVRDVLDHHDAMVNSFNVPAHRIRRALGGDNGV